MFSWPNDNQAQERIAWPKRSLCWFIAPDSDLVDVYVISEKSNAN